MQAIANSPIVIAAKNFLFPHIAERQKRAEYLCGKAFSYKLVLPMEVLKSVPYRDWQKLENAIFRWGWIQDKYRQYLFSDPATRDMTGYPDFKGIMSLIDKYCSMPYFEVAEKLRYLYPLSVQDFYPNAVLHGKPDIFELARLMGFELSRAESWKSQEDLNSFAEALRLRARWEAEMQYRKNILEFRDHPGYGWLENNQRQSDLDAKAQLGDHPYVTEVMALQRVER